METPSEPPRAANRKPSRPSARPPALKACANHPDRDARHVCLKHEVHLCEECRCCHDPELYCRHRSACVIHFLDGDENPSAGDS